MFNHNNNDVFKYVYFLYNLTYLLKKQIELEWLGVRNNGKIVYIPQNGANGNSEIIWSHSYIKRRKLLVCQTDFYKKYL